MGADCKRYLVGLGGVSRPLPERSRMAKKRANKVQTVQDIRAARPVRLDLSQGDHERLQALADERGLSKSSYARMAVLERMKADEAKK
jgi:hypothetical protein